MHTSIQRGKAKIFFKKNSNSRDLWKTECQLQVWYGDDEFANVIFLFLMKKHEQVEIWEEWKIKMNMCS
jgi:hypothetical protein